MNEELALEVKGLTKCYDEKVCALDNVSLEVRQGEWITIMGSSGSGKTTFLNIISGLDRPSQGAVLVNGTDITGLSTDELTRFRRENIVDFDSGLNQHNIRQISLNNKNHLPIFNKIFPLFKNILPWYGCGKILRRALKRLKF